MNNLVPIRWQHLLPVPKVTRRLQQRIAIALKIMLWCGALLAGLQLATVVAAERPAAAKPVAAAPFTTAPVGAAPVATLQEIMLELIDPNVDPLWNAVSTEIAAGGIIETAPTTVEDWQQLKRHALTLAEIAHLLQVPNRPVANGNTSSHVTELQPEAISKLIKAQRPAFDGHAVALQQATLQLLQAIEKRDLAAYEQAGANIEHSCEGCHSQFWYPADKLPPAH